MPPAAAAAARKVEPLDAAPPSLAADIGLRLAAARQELADLKTRVGTMVLDAELSAPGAKQRLVVLNQQIRDADRKVSQLGAAQEVAEGRDATTAATLRHDLRMKSLAIFENVVRTRQEAAEKTAAALAEASAAYRAYIEAQECLTSLRPLDVVFERGELGALNELVPAALVASEMYRLGAESGSAGARTGLALPGAKAPSFQTQNNPASIPAMVDRLAANTKWILSTVRAKVLALAPKEGTAA